MARPPLHAVLLALALGLLARCDGTAISIALGRPAAEGLVEVEPNDALNNATPLTSPAVVRAPIRDEADVDVYRFEGNAGDRVYAATMTAFSARSTDSTLQLLATDGTTLLETDIDDGTFSTTSSTIAGATLPATGVYYLRVSGPGNSEIRPYDLYFQLRHGAPVAEQEPNDSTTSATSLASGWGAGVRNPDSDVDFWSFTLNAGDTVFLSLDLDPERNGVTWNGRLGFGMFGDAANQLVIADDASVITPNSEALFFAVKEAGTYYAYVDSSLVVGGATLTYELGATVFPAPSTEGESCTTYSSTGAVTIVDGGTATSTLTVPDVGRIADLDVVFDVTHTVMADIDVTLAGPDGGAKVLLRDVGAIAAGGQSQMSFVLDDEAAVPVGSALLKGMRYQPAAVHRLSWFDGQPTAGVWTMTVYDDDANGSAGTLHGWSIRICTQPTLPGDTPFYSADFEAGPAGWTHAGTQDEWELGTPTLAPFVDCNSGSKCWKTDLDAAYEPNSEQTLTSPSIAVPQGRIELAWAMKYQCESASFDRFVITVRDVGGVVPDLEVFRFLDGTMGGDAAQVGQGLVNVPVAAGWGVYHADLTAFAGRNVRITASLSSDVTVQFAGLAVDDVSLRVVHVCGDGLMSGDEACDDGNRAAGDGCSPTCTTESAGNDGGPPSDGGPVDDGGIPAPTPAPGVYIPPERGCSAAAGEGMAVLAVMLCLRWRRSRDE